MSDISATLARLVPELQQLSEQNADPAHALARIGELARSTGESIELVWERDDLSKRCHFDALLGLDDGTLSVAYCGDDETPWPMRGAHRWSEVDPGFRTRV